MFESIFHRLDFGNTAMKNQFNAAVVLVIFYQDSGGPQLLVIVLIGFIVYIKLYPCYVALHFYIRKIWRYNS